MEEALVVVILLNIKIENMKYLLFLYSVINSVFEKPETEFERYMREEPEEDIHSFMINRFQK